MSSLLKTKASVHDVSVSPTGGLAKLTKTTASLKTVNALKDRPATQAAEEKVSFASSQENWGLYLRSLTLTRSFEGFLGGLLNPRNEIYLLSCCWDFSGKAPVIIPANVEHASDVRFHLRTGDTRDFIGAGLPLFPARQVHGGLYVRIWLFESDEGSRNVGAIIEQTHETIHNSELMTTLTEAGLLMGGLPAAKAQALKKAVDVTTGLVSDLLQQNADDYVDCFEGVYPVELGWQKGDDEYSGDGVEIVLGKV